MTASKLTREELRRRQRKLALVDETFRRIERAGVASSHVKVLLRFLRSNPSIEDLNRYLAAYSKSFVARYSGSSPEKTRAVCNVVEWLVGQVGQVLPAEATEADRIHEVTVTLAFAERMLRGRAQQSRSWSKKGGQKKGKKKGKRHG